MEEVVRDGRGRRLGTASDVAWINAGTSVGVTITSGIPPVFDDYATVVLPDDPALQPQHDRALIAVLKNQSPDPDSDIVFPDAPPVNMYANWQYVLVQAGPEEAAGRRRTGATLIRPYLIPDLMFPTDRSWLVSTLWDDDWTCVGGTAVLVAALLNHPDLRSRVRRVSLDEEATPPGHRAF